MMAPTLISSFFGCLFQIYGVILTDRFTDAAFLLFEIEAALIDIGDKRDCLGKVDVDRLIV